MSLTCCMVVSTESPGGDADNLQQISFNQYMSLVTEHSFSPNTEQSFWQETYQYSEFEMSKSEWSSEV